MIRSDENAYFGFEAVFNPVSAVKRQLLLAEVSFKIPLQSLSGIPNRMVPPIWIMMNIVWMQTGMNCVESLAQNLDMPVVLRHHQVCHLLPLRMTFSDSRYQNITLSIKRLLTLILRQIMIRMKIWKKRGRFLLENRWP
jgi:hypothetical protein